jgi:hypothetical protein
LRLAGFVARRPSGPAVVARALDVVQDPPASMTMFSHDPHWSRPRRSLPRIGHVQEARPIGTRSRVPAAREDLAHDRLTTPDGAGAAQRRPLFTTLSPDGHGAPCDLVPERVTGRWR